MKKIFLDTNFLIDFLERKEFKAVCQEILITGKEKKLKFYVNFLSLANFAFINRKKEKEILYQALNLLTSMFKVVDNSVSDIRRAIEIGANDFEDALQYSSALTAKCDCIITRNKKDFSFSSLPILSPEEFLQYIKRL